MSAEVSIPAHGGQLRKIAAMCGVRAEGLLDFSANINPEGASALALRALRDALQEPARLREYPDLEEMELKLALGAAAGVGAEAISVANGFVPLLDAVLQALEVRRCLVPIPAFGEYRRALERAGVGVRAFALDSAKDFRYEPQALLAALKDEACDAVLLANPQNPSGVLCEGAALREFVEEAAKAGVRVLLDEAFIDYAPGQSLVGAVQELANLVVFRSVTKFHGIPGLRVAYAAAASAVTRAIYERLPPWPITTLAAVAVRAAVGDRAYAERALPLNAGRRDELAARLRALGLGVYPAAANYLLLRFSSVRAAETCWRRLIVEDGIALRSCTNFEGLTHDHLRCAVLGEAENERLVQALERKAI